MEPEYRIETECAVAHDTIYVTNESGHKILEKSQLDSLRMKLEASFKVSP